MSHLVTGAFLHLACAARVSIEGHICKGQTGHLSLPVMTGPVILTPTPADEEPNSGDSTSGNPRAGPGAPPRMALVDLVLEGHKSLAWPCVLGDYDPGFLCHTQDVLNCSHWGPMVRVCCLQGRLPWALDERDTWLFVVLGWVSGVQRCMGLP